MDFNISPANFGEERRKHILSHFGVEDNVEKSITTAEFNEKYSVGFDVFSLQDLSNFEKAALEADGNTEEVSKAIKSEFESLTEVLVQTGDNKVVSAFVREMKPEGSEEDSE